MRFPEIAYNRASRGFTLTSLVVALAVMSLVVLSSMQLFGLGRTLFSKSSWRQTRLRELQETIRRFREDLENASNQYSSIKQIETLATGVFEIKKLKVKPKPFHYRAGTVTNTSKRQELFYFSICQLATMEIISDTASDDYHEGSRIDAECSLEDGTLYYLRTQYEADNSSRILFPRRSICQDVSSVMITTEKISDDPQNKCLVKLRITVENPRDSKGNKTSLHEETSVIINVEAIPDL